MNIATQDVAQKSIDLSEQVVQTAKHYLMNAKGKDADFKLYQLILEAVETSLFRTTMEKARYNQCRAVRMLGISRGSFRIKLKRYFGDEFISPRDGES